LALANVSLLRLYDVETARRTILRRVPPDVMDVPESVLDGIEEKFGERLRPEQAVARILADVRERGDAALRDWTHRLDGVDLDEIAVPHAALEAALRRVPAEQVGALELAIERVRAFHTKQPLTSWLDATPDGSLGQMVRPVERVGVYVPAGSAPLPSSLLMSAVPAQVAGVGRIVVCAPPGADGEIAPIILATAAIVGVDAVYRLGGAQAIAAMAYGTESVPCVDKIVGPGNLFVTLAKRQVFGAVGIDGLPGPTETVVIADEQADPGLAAADLLAQAEHDVLASAILLTPSQPLAEANDYAAEHLCLLVADPWAWLGRVRNAGGVFLGESSFEVLGDYVAGPSHVMPTGGTARFASPLNVLDFVKITSVIGLAGQSARELSRAAATLAEAESLTAHAAAARARVEEPTE
jgi:histidinol dehydrogenase